MNLLVITYLIYVTISVILTFWVGRTLFTNGRHFLLGIFKNDTVLVDSLNKLLLIGFYLINFGYILRNLAIYKAVENWAEIIEMLSIKIGLIVIVLGMMHFFNLFILFLFRKKNKPTTVLDTEHI